MKDTDEEMIRSALRFAGSLAYPKVDAPPLPKRRPEPEPTAEPLAA